MSHMSLALPIVQGDISKFNIRKKKIRHVALLSHRSMEKETKEYTEK